MPEFRVDHVAVAVHSLKPAVKLFRDALGGEYLMGGPGGPDWRWLQFRWPGGGKIELLEPTGEGFVSRFLDKRGEGLHHVTMKTDDIEAAIAQVQATGYELVDVNLSNEHWKEAFFRPSGAHGTLIQIAQSKHGDEEASRHMRPPEYDELMREA